MALDTSILDQLFGSNPLDTSNRDPLDMDKYNIQPDPNTIAMREQQSVANQAALAPQIDQMNQRPGFFGVDRRALAAIGAQMVKGGQGNITTPLGAMGLGVADYTKQLGDDANTIFARAAAQATLESQRQAQIDALNASMKRQDMKDQLGLQREDVKSARQIMLGQMQADRSDAQQQMITDRLLQLQAMKQDQKNSLNNPDMILKNRIMVLNDKINQAKAAGSDDVATQLQSMKEDALQNYYQILGKKISSVNANTQATSNDPEGRLVQPTGDPLQDKILASNLRTANSEFLKTANIQNVNANALIGTLSQFRQQFFPQDAKDTISYLKDQMDQTTDVAQKAALQDNIDKIMQEKITPLGRLNEKAGMLGSELSNVVRLSGTNALADSISKNFSSDQQVMLQHLQSILTEQGIGAYRVPGTGRMTNQQMDIIKNAIPNTKNMTPQALDMGIELLQTKMKLLQAYNTGKAAYISTPHLDPSDGKMKLGNPAYFDKMFASEYSGPEEQKLTNRLNSIKGFYQGIRQ